MRILFGAIEPGMLQVMIMAAAGLMIPLEKREHAPLRIVLGLLAGFVTGGLLSTIDLDRVIIEYSGLKRPGYRGSGTIVPQQ